MFKKILIVLLVVCFLLGMATRKEKENVEKAAEATTTEESKGNVEATTTVGRATGGTTVNESGKGTEIEEAALTSGVIGNWTQAEIEYFQKKEYVGDKRVYTEEELIPPYIGDQATKEEKLRYIRLLRNEIFARRGFEFKSEDLKEFFEKMNWYKPLYSFYQSVVLNEWEGDNARLIRKKEINLKAEGKEEVLRKGYVKTVVETTMGYGSEGLGFRMWEGAPDYPISIVADSKMRIYVFDHLNNRIRVYSEDGAHLRDIKVNVYEEASLEEMEKERGGLAFAKLYGNEMFMENDTIYIPVRDGFFFSSNLVKTIKVYPEKNSNWKVEEIKNRGVGIGDRFNAKISKMSGVEAEVNLNRQLIIRNIEMGSENIIELPHDMKKVFIDKEKNIYVANLWGDMDDYPQLYGIVQKYSKEGEKIRELKIPFTLDAPFVDKNGNVFALQRVPEFKEYAEIVDPGVVKITIWR